MSLGGLKFPLYNLPHELNLCECLTHMCICRNYLYFVLKIKNEFFIYFVTSWDSINVKYMHIKRALFLLMYFFYEEFKSGISFCRSHPRLIDKETKFRNCLRMGIVIFETILAKIYNELKKKTPYIEKQ